MTWLGELLARLLAVFGLAGAPSGPSFQGYVEGEFMLFAAPVAGTLDRLDVRRGDFVAAGASLFALDLTTALAQRDRAAASLV